MQEQLGAALPSVDHQAPSTTSRQLAVRLAVTRTLSRAHDLDGIYEAALDALAECLDLSRAAVLLFDADGVMRFKAHRGLSKAYRAAVEGHSPWTSDSVDPAPLVVPDVTREPSLEGYLPYIERERIAAMAFIPLVSLGRVIGKFMLYHAEPHVFDEEEIGLAQVIAASIGFAVEQARVEDIEHQSPADTTFPPSAMSVSAWEWDVSDRDGRPEGEAGLNGLPSGTLRQINRCVIENSRDCLKVLDLDGRLIYINANGVKVLGLKEAAEVLRRPWVDLWHEKYRETVLEAIARARSGAVGRFQGTTTTPGGVTKSWDVGVSPITDAAGRVGQLLAVSRDVSAPWQRESFRVGQHQVLEMIATGAPLAQILTLLVHLVEEQSDDMLCSVMLLDVDQLHMRHGAAPSLPPTYVHRLDGEPIGPNAGLWAAAMHSRRPVIIGDVLADPVPPEIRDAEIPEGARACWSVPILSPQKRVLGAFGMFYPTCREPDRSERRVIETAADLAGIAIEHGRSQDALRRSEERNRAVLRALPDWVFLLDRDGVFLDYQGRHADNLLMSPEEFIGKSVHDVLPASLAETHDRTLERAFRTDEPETFEYTLDVRGETRFYEACVVRCDADKAVSIVRDTTDRKRAELQVAEQRAELAHLNRALLLGELSGALAHELSQPLAATLMNAQAARVLLDAKSLDVSELKATLDDVISSGKRAGNVIGRLRTLLKKGEGSSQALALNEVASEVLELAHSDLLVRRVSVTRSFAPDLPVVNGDRVQLQQVILNLVLNASEAMTEVEPAERQLGVATACDGDSVRISVSDRGPGIPEAQLESIFDPFVTFREQGLGLGLAISRSIILAHGGKILAENDADGGATFRCFLPVARD